MLLHKKMVIEDKSHVLSESGVRTLLQLRLWIGQLASHGSFHYAPKKGAILPPLGYLCGGANCPLFRVIGGKFPLR